MSDTPDPLELFLSDHDAPCPGCGYNLRGLKGSTCPECKNTVALMIGEAPEGRLAACIGPSLISVGLMLVVSIGSAFYSWYRILQKVPLSNLPGPQSVMWVIHVSADFAMLAWAGVLLARFFSGRQRPEGAAARGVLVWLIAYALSNGFLTVISSVLRE